MTERQSLLVECSGVSRETDCDALPRRSRRLDSLRNINEKTMEPLPAYIVGDYVVEKGRRPYDHRVPGQPARSWAGAKEWWEVRRRATRARPDVAASIGKLPLYVGDTLRECLCWIRGQS